MNEPPNPTPQHRDDDEHQGDAGCPACKGYGFLIQRTYKSLNVSVFTDWSVERQITEPSYDEHRVSCWCCGGSGKWVDALVRKITRV